MSQEQSAPKAGRRKSILAQRQVADEEIEKAIKNHRRVSFRNVKEVQFYDVDVKNCPDLLHDASPVKEKINDTLGSDGVFTPGRTTISDGSTHSSKNNTMDMFGETAKKPIQIAPPEEVAKFEIQGTPPTTHDVTNMEDTDMSIANTTAASDANISSAKESSQLDDTLQMFSRSGAQHDKENRDSMSEDTMVLFHNETIAHETSTQNCTMDMFDIKTAANTTTATLISANDTMDMFRSPVKNPIKKGRISLSSTMAMFESPAQKTAVSQPKRVSMSTTLAMFESPIPEVTNESMDLETSAGPNCTAMMFVETSPLTSVPEEQEPNVSVPMDVSQDDVAFDVTQKNETICFATQKNDTLLITKDKSLSDSYFNNVAGDRSLIEEGFRGATPSNQTMSMVQPNATVLLTEDVEQSLHDSVSIAKFTVVAEEINRSSRPISVLSRTLDAFMTAAENQINEVTRNASRRPSAIEVDRGMNVSMNLYDLVIRDETAIPDKTTLLRRDVSLDNHSLDMSINSAGNRSQRASILSQSIRSRRRSSLSSTIHSFQNSPVTLSDPNMSMEEQLSFAMRSTLFDDYSAQIICLNTGHNMECIQDRTLDKLKEYVNCVQNERKEKLDKLLPELREKYPEKAAAIEALNSRRLGPIDRDIMLSSRYIAEKEWLKKRADISKDCAAELKKITSGLKKKLEEVEEQALLCERLPDLETEVKSLSKEWDELSSLNLDAAKSAEELNKEFLQQIKTEEREFLLLHIEALKKENAFVEQKIREADEIGRVLNAAKRENDLNQQLLLERLRQQTSTTEGHYISGDEMVKSND